MNPRTAYALKALLRATAVALVIALIALHVVQVYTESLNWDEFAMFDRAKRSVLSGTVVGGGRPGLVTVLLMPLVRGCVDAVATIQSARLWWVGATVALAAGLFLLVWQLVRDAERRLEAAVLGTLCLVCVPAFLRWSLQVRTDQLAVMFALWGGNALLASMQHPAWVLAAGAGFALGYLATQKAGYVIALVLVAAAANQWAHGELAARRLALRFGSSVLVAAGCVAGFDLAMDVAGLSGQVIPSGVGRVSFAFYREIVGFRVYAAMLPTLLPQLLLGAVLVFVTVRQLAARGPYRRALLVPWAVLSVGLLVGVFHAAAFPYFWMTLGLFPALALGVAWPVIAASLPMRRAPEILYALVVVSLVVMGARYKLGLLEDTQAIQRASFDFIERELPAGLKGFHVDGGLFCRDEPEPLPVYLRERVAKLFNGADAPKNIESLLAEHRNRPVAYVVQTHRLPTFPPEIRSFWDDHYASYTARVAVAGRFLTGLPGPRPVFEVLVPGPYRWWAQGQGARRLRIGTRTLSAGETVDLPRGAHTVELLDPLDWGVFAIALDAPPQPSDRPFYSGSQLAEITGGTFR